MTTSADPPPPKHPARRTTRACCARSPAACGGSRRRSSTPPTPAAPTTQVSRWEAPGFERLAGRHHGRALVRRTHALGPGLGQAACLPGSACHQLPPRRPRRVLSADPAGQGGLQSYPSRLKDPDTVDFSTGSVGIGTTAARWAAMAHRYVASQFPSSPPADRFISLLGDSELDEGARLHHIDTGSIIDAALTLVGR